MPYLTLPGVDLWYEDTGGDGTPVILLHATSGTCESWERQLPAFTAAGYRCVAYDRRTWGRSMPTDAEHQPGFAGDDLHALVESLGLERVHLVATAAGGITALDYALAHPERTRSLVAANTIGGVQDAEYLEVQHRLRPSEIQNLPVELRELGPSYRGIDPDGAGQPARRCDSNPAAPRANHLRPAANDARPHSDNIGRGRPAVAAGANADAGGAYSGRGLGIAAGRGTRRFLGAAGRLERPGSGVYQPALAARRQPPRRRRSSSRSRAFSCCGCSYSWPVSGS